MKFVFSLLPTVLMSSKFGSLTLFIDRCVTTAVARMLQPPIELLTALQNAIIMGYVYR